MLEPRKPGPSGAHWGWFVGLLIVLFAAGLFVAFISLFPLAMATDGCHTGSTDRICDLSARGQKTLVLIPWAALFVGSAAAVAGAFLVTRIRWTPVLGIPIGLAAAAAMIPLGGWVAFHV